MNSQPSSPLIPAGLWATSLFSAFVLGISRFAGAPMIDFCADDWRILDLARQYPTFFDAWAVVPRWPDRPFGTFALIYGFSQIGEELSGYAVLGFLFGVLFMFFTSLLAFELTGSRFCAYLTGIVFATLPTLTETFQWATMILYGLGFIAYPAAGWAALIWLRLLKIEWLIASTILFAFALGTYEVGLFLPVMFLALWKHVARGALVRAIVTWGLISLLYLAWKFTGAFGLSHDLLFPSRSIDWSQIHWRWNAFEAARWWIGGHFGDAVREGWNGFSCLPPHRQRILVVTNIILCAIVVALARRLRNSEINKPGPTPYPAGATLAFTGLWFILGQALNLVSWSGPRLALVPSVGFAICVAWALRRIDPRIWSPAAVAILTLFLIANQGTSQQWLENSRFQRALFNSLKASKTEWDGKDLIVFDSARLRQKRLPGLSDEICNDPRLWAYYGNTVFLRGFVLRSMLNLITERPPTAILDTEHKIEWARDRVRWSGWYETELTFETPIDRVHVIDLLAAGSSMMQNL